MTGDAMTGTVLAELTLTGRSELAAALVAAADRRGLSIACADFAHQDKADLATLTGPGGRLPVPAVPALGRLVVEDALDRIQRRWPTVGPACATVLAPAGGVTGPADAGPVDALVVGPHWTYAGPAGQCGVRLLTAQHTRCWLLSYAGELADGAPGPVAAGLELVPAWLATDTARLAEYAQDRGLGSQWPVLLQLGEPARGPGRRFEALFAFTEASYADRLIDRLTGSWS